MLDGRSDDVLAILRDTRLGQAQNGQVVTLGRATGEDHLIPTRIHHAGNLIAGLLSGLLGPCAKLMATAALVAEFLGQKVEHDITHLGFQGGSRIAIQIDRQHKFSKNERRTLTS